MKWFNPCFKTYLPGSLQFIWGLTRFVLIYHSDGLNNMFFQVCILEMVASMGIAERQSKDRGRDPVLWSMVAMSSA